MLKRFPVLLCAVLLAACSDGEDNRKAPPPWVKTRTVAAAGSLQLALTGTVRARYETPVAFRVGGQITRREVDAGQSVAKGAVLFRLDPRDLAETLSAAAAERAAARAALTVAQADTSRHRQLFEKTFVSRQLLERIELAEREVQTRVDAADARWQQARNAGSYAVLRAEAAGLLLDVSGEPGQVVAAGQPVAVMARDGEREVEVSFPDSVKPPAAGLLRHPDGTTQALQLREVSGAADPVSLTWRARYRFAPGSGKAPALGAVVSTRFALAGAADGTLEVPLGALDERGHGPRVWLVREGKAQPQPVRIVLPGPETARIVASLPADARLIVLGTHLLEPGMAVRELPQ